MSHEYPEWFKEGCDVTICYVDPNDDYGYNYEFSIGYIESICDYDNNDKEINRRLVVKTKSCADTPGEFIKVDEFHEYVEFKSNRKFGLLYVCPVEYYFIHDSYESYEDHEFFTESAGSENASLLRMYKDLKSKYEALKRSMEE